MGFFVLGVHHQNCPLEIREKLHFTAPQIFCAFEKMKRSPGISELAILSTCNRVEFYGYTESPSLPVEPLVSLIEETHQSPRDLFLSYLYRFEGKEMIRHLFRVAAGLDSLVVGENEILGQLREAFRMARQTASVHSYLYRLMEKALKVGKEIRTKTKINEGAISIPSVAVELAQKIFGRLAREKVMVLGTGEMSEITLKNLKAAGAEILYIASRNSERGESLAREFQAQRISLDAWEPCLSKVDILIASTSAPHPLVTYPQIERVMEARKHRPLFLIDIAVPRDIEAEVNSLDDVYLYNIDDLKGVAASNLKLRCGEIQNAEDLVEKALGEYQGWLEGLKARPTLERFKDFLDTVLEKELDLFVRESGVPEPRKKETRERIRAKLMHRPLEKIKEASQNGGVARYLDALHSLFDLDNDSSELKKQEK